MPPGLRVLIEHHAMIAERREVARDRQRGGAAADERDALAVLVRGRLRQARADVVLVVGGDTLQAANRHRLLLHASAPAGRLARPVAGAPENSGKHVRFPVDHVGVAVAALPRSTGCIREQACAPGTPTGNPRPCGSSRAPKCRWVSSTPLHARLPRSREPRASKCRPGPSHGSACRAPNPARILVDAPPEFHRYIRHIGAYLPHRNHCSIAAAPSRASDVFILRRAMVNLLQYRYNRSWKVLGGSSGQPAVSWQRAERAAVASSAYTKHHTTTCAT